MNCVKVMVNATIAGRWVIETIIDTDAFPSPNGIVKICMKDFTNSDKGKWKKRVQRAEIWGVYC